MVWLLSIAGLVLSVGTAPRALAETTAEDPLDHARALLAAGDVDGAASQARRVIAASPDRGSAYLVLGLAHFRAGRYREALQAFTAAQNCATPASPGPVAFNRGSALFALQDYAAAQASFNEAAQVAPDLRFLATVNGAESALAVGDFATARQHATAAKPLATTPERQAMLDELVERLDRESDAARLRYRESRRDEARAALAADHPAQAELIYRELLSDSNQPALTAAQTNLLEYGLGLALMREGRYPEAEPHFARAAALDSHDGDSLYMQGLAAYRRDAGLEARTLFGQALRRGIDAETESSARGFLDRLSFASRRSGGGGSLGFSAGVGYDSNVIQGSDTRPEAMKADQVGRASAAFATASANLGHDWLLGKIGFLGADYLLDQLAYPDADHQDYSMQAHRLRLRTEWSPSPLFRVGLLGSDQLQFAGLDRFRLFQNIVSLEPSLAFDELPTTSTYLRFAWQNKHTFDADYSFYSGSRMDLRLGQKLRWKNIRAELAGQLRRERIGVRTATLLEVESSQSFKFRKRKKNDPLDQASYVYVAPFSYDSGGVFGRFEVDFGRLRLSTDASGELLNFRGTSTVNFVAPSLNISRMSQTASRRDLMLTGTLTASLSLNQHLDLLLHYQIIDNRSTLVLDVDNRNYTKHVVGLTVEGSW